MKEKPVLFNAEMVRAILDGRKTQTRRAIKFPIRDKDFGCDLSGSELAGEISSGNYRNSPFGAVGDRLWVRETFRVHSRATDVATLVYKASQQQSWTQQTHRVPIEKCNKPASVEKWTPSIHMPRWASRITLEITGVRVERLASISEEDARSEGVGSAIWFAAKGVDDGDWTSLGEHGAHFSSHINSFATLWESIYGADSWQANPWVWCISFRRVE